VNWHSLIGRASVYAVNKLTFMKSASPQLHRRDAATASTRYCGSVLQLYRASYTQYDQPS